MPFPIRPAVLLAVVAGAWGADEAGGRADLRLFADHVPSYTVTEKAGGTLDWRGTPDVGWNFGGECLRVVPRAGEDAGCWVYGLRLDAGAQTAKPTGYSANGTHYANQRDEQLTWRRVGLGVVAGWQTGQTTISQIRLIGELTAYAEALGVHALIKDTADGDASIGWGYEAGARAAVLIAESDWYGGVALSAVYGHAEVDFQYYASTHTMELDRSGVGLGVIVGHRF